MALRLLVFGKTKVPYFQDSEQEYLKRIQRYVKLEYKILDAAKGILKRDPSIAFEEKVLLKHIDSRDFLILLDEGGKKLSSVALAASLEKHMAGSGRLVFAIGGAFGFSKTIKQRANLVLSLSDLTFPHHLVRTIFLEQLYRSLTIIRGESYHNP